MTAWWPSLEVEKTFDISQSEEEVGFGVERIDRIIRHSERTSVPQTDTELDYRVTPKESVSADFPYGIITVRAAMHYTKLEFPAPIPDEVFTLDFLKEQSALLIEGGHP